MVLLGMIDLLVRRAAKSAVQTRIECAAKRTTETTSAVKRLIKGTIKEMITIVI
jgi:hypothetical protein